MTMEGLFRATSVARDRVWNLSICAYVVAASLPAVAQQASESAAADTTEMQEIVVTGSMIARPVAETAEAVTILKADALKDQGVVNVEQVINTLISAAPTVNIAANVGSFSGGGSYANLRHLGDGSTL